MYCIQSGEEDQEVLKGMVMLIAAKDGAVALNLLALVTGSTCKHPCMYTKFADQG